DPDDGWEALYLSDVQVDGFLSINGAKLQGDIRGSRIRAERIYFDDIVVSGGIAMTSTRAVDEFTFGFDNGIWVEKSVNLATMLSCAFSMFRSYVCGMFRINSLTFGCYFQFHYSAVC